MMRFSSIRGMTSVIVPMAARSRNALRYPFGLWPKIARQGFAHLERHAHAREIGKRVSGILAVRVDDGNGAGQFAAGVGRVVIRDNHVYAGFPRVFHFFHALNAAVRRDDEFYAVVFGLLDKLLAHVVAVAPAMRHEHVHIRAQTAQHPRPQRGRSHAIPVIIAMHPDFLIVGKRLLQAFAGLFRVREQKRIVQAVERGIEKAIGSFGRVQSPLHEQSRKMGWTPNSICSRASACMSPGSIFQRLEVCLRISGQWSVVSDQERIEKKSREIY